MIIDLQPIHILTVVVIVAVVYLSTLTCSSSALPQQQGIQIRVVRPSNGMMIPITRDTQQLFAHNNYNNNNQLFFPRNHKNYHQQITDTPLVVNAPNGQSGTLIPVTSTDSNVQGIVNTNGRIIAPVYAPTDQSISTSLVPLTQEQFMNLVKNKPKIIKKLR